MALKYVCFIRLSSKYSRSLACIATIPSEADIAGAVEPTVGIRTRGVLMAIMRPKPALIHIWTLHVGPVLATPRTRTADSRSLQRPGHTCTTGRVGRVETPAAAERRKTRRAAGERGARVTLHLPEAALGAQLRRGVARAVRRSGELREPLVLGRVPLVVPIYPLAALRELEPGGVGGQQKTLLWGGREGLELEPGGVGGQQKTLLWGGREGRCRWPAENTPVGDGEKGLELEQGGVGGQRKTLM